MEAETEPHLARTVLVRGALLGAVLAGVFAFAFQGEGSTFTLGAALAGFFAGLVLGAATLVEARARCHDPSFERDVVAFAATTLVAFGAGWLIIFQVPYTVATLENGSLEAGLRVLRSVHREVRHDPGIFFCLIGTVAPIFGANAFIRLRELGRLWRSGGSVFLGALASAPSFLLLLAYIRSTRERLIFGACVAACVVAIPLVHEVADAIERRLAAREA